MADCRMIHRDAVCSDAFIEMSHMAQALYFQLVMEADSFGFVDSVRRIIRSIDASMEALEELITSGFVIRFDTGVYVIRHWMLANGNFKNDRNYEARFPKELAQVYVDNDLTYALRNPDGFQTDSRWSPDGVQTESSIQHKSYSRVHIITQIINNALERKGLSSSSSSQSDRQEEEEEKPETVVSIDQRTGKQLTLREAIEKSPGVFRISEDLWTLIDTYRSKGLDDELIYFAFNQTCLARPQRPPAYFRSVMDDYLTAGYTSVEEARKHEAERYK